MEIGRFLRRLSNEDKAIHAYFVERFPRATQIFDGFMEWLFNVISHGAFALIVALMLVVLVITDKISLLVGICIGGAWLVAFVWIARAKRIGGLTILTRTIVVSAVGISLAVIAIEIGTWAMNSYVASKAPKPEADNPNDLTGSIRLPPSGEPLDSIFTLSNLGKADIPTHRLLCRINLAVYENEVVISKGKNWLVSQAASVPLLSGGDSDSEACLSQLLRRKLRCADLTFRYDYETADQLGRRKTHEFRFAFHTSFGWFSVPIKENGSRCDKFDTPVTDISTYKIQTACQVGCTFKSIQEAANAVKCGTVIYFDVNEVINPQHPMIVAGKGYCGPKRQIVFRASVDPLNDAKQREWR